MKDARTILSKKYGMSLIDKGFKLIDLQPSIKIPNEIAFIFEKSEALEEEFNILVNAERVMKNMYGLTFKDIRTLIGVLQGYSISDEERFSIMDKLQNIDDMITGYKASVTSEDPIKEEANEVSEINVDGLMNVMNGSK
jgi:hypothetical protein